MITIDKFYYSAPKKELKNINLSWTDFAKMHRIKRSELIKFLKGCGLIVHYDVGKEKEILRILPSDHFRKFNCCDVFQASGSNGKKYSQSKITRLGMSFINTIYSDELKKMSEGVPASKLLKRKSLKRFI